MIVLGNLGVADKRLMNKFLDEWWYLDQKSYKDYYKKTDIAEEMIIRLKYHDPLLYDVILDSLESRL